MMQGSPLSPRHPPPLRPRLSLLHPTSTLQTLARQLAESKDSLQFSNQLCEQLESKVEELESSNRSLAKLCEGRRSLLAQKASDMTQMEAELTDVRDKFDGVREDLSRLRRDSAAAAITLGGGGVAESGAGTQRNGRAHRRASPNYGADGTDGAGEGSDELVRLKDSIAELSLKLQNTTFQKNRLKRELDEAMSENVSLAKNLERTEADLTELQLRYDEMISESHAMDGASVLSPSCIPLSPFHSNTSLTATGMSTGAPPASSQMEPTANGGQSLFSELGSELSSLQQQSQELLPPNSSHSSTISASSAPTLSQQEGGASENGISPTATKCESSGAFKELFEEMFATLRQTAKVADRLLERRSQ